MNDKGRVVVDDHLRVEGMDGVWAIGDCAAAPDVHGGYSPPTAQHGVRQARLTARNIAAALYGTPPTPYTYSSRTAFVNLGRYKAVGPARLVPVQGLRRLVARADLPPVQIPGLFRKVRAVMDWTVSLPFGRDTSEVGSIGHPRPLSEEQYERGGSHRPVGTAESA